MNAELAHKRLHAQRSQGILVTHLGTNGLVRHREEGCLKLRIPFAAQEGILINTSGGLAGGDQLSTKISVGQDAHFTLTSQAAERVYRTLGPAAKISHQFEIEEGASLFWLPQETILFDGSALHRSLTVKMRKGAKFLAVEAFVLGRTAMAETLSQFDLRDSWNVYRGEKLIHEERLAMSGGVPNTLATLHSANAFATVLLVDDFAERHMAKLQAVIGTGNGISCWNGKLLARFTAKDGFLLRKTLKAVLSVCLDGISLPRNWEI